jgi:hypothetical protein
VTQCFYAAHNATPQCKAMREKYIIDIIQHMIPRVWRNSPTDRATRAQVVRAGTRTAGIGERNIHHADCTNVTVHRGNPVHASIQTHLSKRNRHGVRRPGRKAQPPGITPSERRHGYHTPNNTPHSSFFLKNCSGRERHPPSGRRREKRPEHPGEVLLCGDDRGRLLEHQVDPLVTPGDPEVGSESDDPFSQGIRVAHLP